MRFSGIFQTISFTVRKRFVNAFLPPPYTVGKPSKNAPKRLKKFAMPAAKTRTLCRRLAASRHQKTALYGHFSASCRFLHSKPQPVGPFLILRAFSQFYPYIFLEIGDFSNNHGKFYYRVFNLEEQTNYEVRLFLFETSTDNKLIRIIDLVNDSFIVNNRENYQEVIALNEDGQAVVFETWAPVQSFISVNDLLNSVPNYHEIELPQPA